MSIRSGSKDQCLGPNGGSRNCSEPNGAPGFAQPNGGFTESIKSSSGSSQSNDLAKLSVQARTLSTELAWLPTDRLVPPPERSADFRPPLPPAADSTAISHNDEISPKYTFQPPFNFRSSQPAPFRPQQPIIPSTHRPNYSHLFSHFHNRNPSQTETFRRIRQLQEMDSIWSHFCKSLLQVVKSKTTTEAVGVEKTTTGRSYEETTIEQLHEETTTDFDYDTTLDPSVDYEEQPVSHESIDVNSQEEEASRVSQESSYVNSQEEPSKVPHESVDVNSQEEASKAASQEADDRNDSQEEFDDYVTSEEQQIDSREGPKRSSEENNDIRNEDYEESESQEEKVKTTNATSFEIVTTKPSAMVKDDHFHEFVDTTVIDNVTEELMTTVEDSSDAVQEKKSKSEALETVEEKKSKSEAVEEKKSKSEALLAEPELVVSVVTTKSVVNNTVIPSVTSPPTVTVGTIDDNTTDTWVVVASVQTSRSVSGARYLPSPNVEQDERMKLLNEEVEDVTETTTEEVPTTTLPPTTTKLKTSTESLIDKLDRVQSDLSSSLLTGGFNNEGNNIAVITENMSHKMATTMLDLGITSPQPTPPPPSCTKSSLPLVQIRKFSPLARPSTTTRPKKTFDSFKQNRKTTTTVAPVNLDQPQGDEPPKDEGKNATTGRTSGVSNKTQIIVQDVSAFLPPGYKASDKDKEDTSKLLAEILGKVRPSEESETKNKSM
ncbi:LOW QUALITY PROTEIN: chemotaxis regulatory protein ChePep-like [Tenebrio molitor]|uniref:LOW QUALITY PROTEIN: chemotaxis regulatory protein ChePep-like n=1 Tax=Tenebrio molitor TaxID=7067 RepID=UPI00362474FD